MHMSMHNWMRSEPLEVTLARLARCGYGSIEIKGEPDQYDTKDVRKQLDDYELSCWGAVTLTLGDRNLCAKDEQQRAATVQYMKDVVTMVKELDGQEITIVPGHGRQGRSGRHARRGVGLVRRRVEGDPRTRQRVGSPHGDRRRSTGSRRTSSTGATRRWRWPTPSLPTSACASTRST